MSDEPTPESHGPVLAAELNALPARLKRYVLDLEQRADPAGDVRRAYVAEEKAMALELQIQELDRDIANLRNDVLSLTLQRDHALRECEQVRDALVLQGQEGGKLVRSLQGRLAAYDAALTAVRGERPEVVAIAKRFAANYPDASTDRQYHDWIHCDLKALLSALDASDSTEAAWRNAARLWKSETAARDERIERLTRALQQIAMPMECACLPCTGQCRSAESLQIEIDAQQDLARAALAPPQAEQLDADDRAALNLCSDCPPAGYPTDKTRCRTCPLRAQPQAEHVCGLQGYNGMIDPPCPHPSHQYQGKP